MHDFEISHFWCERFIDDLKKILTSLKLFVEKKYLKSRRAPRASTKTPKVQKTLNNAYN